MASRTTLFNHFCKPLTEINAPSTTRGWVLNEYSRAEFSISTSDPKCTEANVQFGNMVHIEHLPSVDEGGSARGKLPDWTGMLLPPRNWDYGVLHLTAYSAEAVLAFRAMPFVTVSGTPGTMFRTILNLAQATANNIVVQPGVIEDIPQVFSDDLTLSAYDHILALVNDAGMEWNVTGQVAENGSLELFGNLYRRRGVKTDLVLTNLNTELASPLLSEQGTPSNQVFGYSHAYTKESRIKSIGLHQEAYNDYGALQANIVFAGKHDENSVNATAQNYALARGRPVKKVHRVALDRQDTFSKLEPGNTCLMRETVAGFAAGGGLGFEGETRIISVDYNDLTNNAPLNLEVI